MILELKKLKKHFGGIKALDGVSMNIEKGKITAIIGPNGSGKSTLFHVISNIVKMQLTNITFASIIYLNSLSSIFNSIHTIHPHYTIKYS